MSGGTRVGPPPASRGPRCDARDSRGARAHVARDFEHRLGAEREVSPAAHPSPRLAIGDGSHEPVEPDSPALSPAPVRVWRCDRRRVGARRRLAGGAAAVAAADCPSMDVAPTAANAAEIRTSVLCLTNAERSQRGLVSLRENSKLRSAALAHSTDMVRDGYFAHTAPGGDTFVDRILAAGYASRTAAGRSVRTSPGAPVTSARLAAFTTPGCAPAAIGPTSSRRATASSASACVSVSRRTPVSAPPTPPISA